MATKKKATKKAVRKPAVKTLTSVDNQTLHLTTTSLTLLPSHGECHGYELQLADLKKALQKGNRKKVACLSVLSKYPYSDECIGNGRKEIFDIGLIDELIQEDMGHVASIGCVCFDRKNWNKILVAMGMKPLLKAKKAAA